MAFLTLLVCSLLVTSAYSQFWFGGGGNSGGYGGGNTGGNGGHDGGNTGGNGGYGGGNTGGNGGFGGGNNGGGFNNGQCSCNLNCVDVKANGNTARCQNGYTAVSCACGMGCGSYNIQGSNTCVCQCLNVGWASARCCRNV